MPAGNTLEGETIVVTGASAGIGRETVHQLAAEGANVSLAARREERLSTVAAAVEDEYGVETLVSPTDVTDPESVEALVDNTVETFGSLDAVVSNAGVIRESGITELSTEGFTAMMRTNTFGAFYVARASLPFLRSSEGTLLFVGSFDGKFPRTGNPVYAATKWWLRGFAHSVEAREGQSGVAVSLVNPSTTRTEIGRQDGESYEERYDSGEILEPEDVAAAIVFALGRDRGTVSELDLFDRDRITRDPL